ncbi:MAG TPA: aminopeptidase P family protein [Candidatus Aquilonibacter sp.]|nr:aminopeptidase P family protein [Candidatus Aquilonibacter sp.]
MQHRERRKAALAAAQEAGADSMVVTHLADVRWLSGFTGSSAAIALGRKGSALFTDGRYTTQAKAEAAGLKVVIGKSSPGAQAAAWLAESKGRTGGKRCAFDAANTTVAALDAMRKALPAGQRRSFFVATQGLVARLRQIKDAGEIAKMRRAAALGCKLFEGVLTNLSAGETEAEIALAMEFEARRAGAEAMSFETIVASGKRSALPHGRAGRTKLPHRGFVTLDFGVLLEGYCSDMTRTVHLGRATQREWDVYHSVLEAQQAGVMAVRPGARCGDVDEAARSVLRKAKLERWFTHSTGHGVGLEIHEGPRIAAKQEQVLEPGMIVTIEPGVYLPGAFGVRIEDMVLVTGRGHEVLTKASPKVWIEL